MNSRSLTTIFLLGYSLATAGAAAPKEDFQSVKIEETVAIAFPEALVPIFHEGEVHVAMSVDPEGNLVEWLVTRYTHKRFADAAIEAFPHWKFEPARFKGQPIGSCFELRLLFEVRGVIVSVSSMDVVESFMNSMHREDAYAPCRLGELDRIPTPLNAVAPPYPSELYDRGERGQVTVDFYIDETGRVRIPSVVDAGENIFAPFAVAAVRQWKFEPPTRRGRPVLVHAQQLFRFQPAVAAATAAR